MTLEEAQAALAEIDALLAQALLEKDEAWKVWDEAKKVAKGLSDRRDPIAEECWRLEAEARAIDEAEFRAAYNAAKLEGGLPLKVGLDLNGGSDNG